MMMPRKTRKMSEVVENRDAMGYPFSCALMGEILPPYVTPSNAKPCRGRVSTARQGENGSAVARRGLDGLLFGALDLDRFVDGDLEGQRLVAELLPLVGDVVEDDVLVLEDAVGDDVVLLE